MGTNYYWTLQPYEGRHIGKISAVAGIRVNKLAPQMTWADDPVRAVMSFCDLALTIPPAVTVAKDEYGHELTASEMCQIINQCAGHDYTAIGEDFS